jgi:hypothetical protein
MTLLQDVVGEVVTSIIFVILAIVAYNLSSVAGNSMFGLVVGLGALDFVGILVFLLGIIKILQN